MHEINRRHFFPTCYKERGERNNTFSRWLRGRAASREITDRRSNG